MVTFRVVLLVDVDDEAIARSRDEETLEEWKRAGDGDGYYDDYVTDEIGWLHQSFSDVVIESMERVASYANDDVDDDGDLER